MRAEKSVGKASASSSALVCNDCVPPAMAAMASIVVRTALLKTSWAVNDHPEVWQCVRNASDLSEAGPNVFTSLAHNSRAARSLAISMK